MDGIQLSADVLQSMQMAKVFHQNKKRIVSLDYDDTGEYCITASEDESFSLYSCKSGTDKKVFYSKKYGIHHCRFAHTSTTVVHTSTKEDGTPYILYFRNTFPLRSCADTIRYHSLHDNKYIRYFKGHKRRVVSLDMSPVDDTFISGSIDDTVRLWDLRSPNCQGLVNINGAPCVAFDPSGAVFAIGLDSNTVRLYDIRNFDKGPFAMIPSQGAGTGPIFRADDSWTGIKFSNNGSDMLISTRQERIYLVDSINCNLRHVLDGYENKLGLDMEASFTPDGKYVLSGSQDGNIYAWDTESGKQAAQMKGHNSPVSVVQMNPKYLLMVSGSSSLAFWIPISDWSSGTNK